MENKIKNNEAVIIEFHQRFASGEQYLILTKHTWDSEILDCQITEQPKDFYWQERGIYNHTISMVEFAKSKNLNLTEEQIYGENGLVAQLVPHQRKYNDIQNKKYEFINRICYPNIVVEDGSIDIDNLEEEGLAPSKIFTYRQGSTPPQFITTNLDIYEILDKELQKIWEKMSSITNQFMEN